MIIGIDVGGSTTKIVGVKDGEIRNPMFVTAKDPVTSLFGAFGKYIYDHSIQLSEVEQVMLTGVGSSYIQRSECPVCHGAGPAHGGEYGNGHFLCEGGT